MCTVSLAATKETSELFTRSCCCSNIYPKFELNQIKRGLPSTERFRTHTSFGVERNQRTPTAAPAAKATITDQIFKFESLHGKHNRLTLCAGINQLTLYTVPGRQRRRCSNLLRNSVDLAREADSGGGGSCLDQSGDQGHR